MTPLPLEGIRAVNLSVIWAGPWASWQFASLGAEMIHVDNPHHQPDYGRGFTMWPPPSQARGPLFGGVYPNLAVGERPWNRNAGYNRYLWNQKACSINLNDPEGLEIFKRLIKVSDVFLENNGANAMEHMGIGPEVLMEVNPQLICINMPAWGRSGPYKDFVGWGALHEAVSGHDWLRGYPDDEHPGHNLMRFHMDSAGGAMAVNAAIMGLIYRRRTGKGIWVDFGQIYNVPNQLGEIYMDAAWNGRNQRSLGNRHPTAVQGCYPCRGPESTLYTTFHGGERWVNITINNDEEWRGFCEALGNPEWTKDAKFADPISRRANHDELDANITAWTKQHDNFEVFYVLQQHGVPAGPVEDWRDTYMDPQLNTRDWFNTMTQADCGTHRYQGFPWNFTGTPLRVKNPPPLLNEHTEEVCKGIIGMSDEEYEDLRAREKVGMDYYPWAGPSPQYG